MKPERWQHLDELFHSALQREPGQRAAFLDDACAGDETPRRQIGKRESIKRPISVPVSPQSAVECYPCREVSLNYSDSLLFQGGDTGSIPVRDANILKNLSDPTIPPRVQKNPLSKSCPPNNSKTSPLVECYRMTYVNPFSKATLRQSLLRANSLGNVWSSMV
jgi:hypothetical protein